MGVFVSRMSACSPGAEPAPSANWPRSGLWLCTCGKIGPMEVRAGAGIASGDQGVDGFAEAASRAALGLGGGPCQLAVVFAGRANLDHAEEGLAAARERLRPE